MVRVGPMIGVPALLARLGCDPSTVLARAELTPDDLQNPDHRLTYQQADAALVTCAREAHCPHFGLLLGQMSEPRHLGIAGLSIYVAPTVRQALESVVEMIDLHDEAISISLDVGADYTRFTYLMHEPRVTSIEIAHDLTAAMMSQILRTVCGPLWLPNSISLPRRQPEDATPYNRFFRAPIFFNATELAVTFENHWLVHSPASANLSRYRQIWRQAALLHNKMDKDFIDALPPTILQGLLKGAFTSHEVAGALGMHERTLHRRLTASGTSFRQELNSVRQSFAEQLLEGTDMPIGDIAATLGYSHASSFIRAFERWCTVSPVEWRKQHRSTLPEEVTAQC